MRGDGRVFKRGANWWIGYYAPKNGKSTEHREPGGKTEAEARKLLKARLQEIAVHRAGVRPFQGPRQEKITVDELLDALERDHEIRGRKSLRELRCHAKPIRDFFALDLALGVTADRLRDYIAHRQEGGGGGGDHQAPDGNPAAVVPARGGVGRDSYGSAFPLSSRFPWPSGIFLEGRF